MLLYELRHKKLMFTHSAYVAEIMKDETGE